MPNEMDTEVAKPGTTQPPAEGGTTPAPAGTEPAPAGEGAARSDGKVELSTSDFKRLKEKAAKRGFSKAAAEYEAKLKLAEDELAKFRAAAEKAAKPPEGAAPPADAAKEAEAKIAAKAAEDTARREAEFERQRTRLRDKARRKDQELELHRAAASAGVRDTDVAVTLLVRHMKGLSRDEMKKLPRSGYPEKFFEGLRERHPSIFGERVEQANTGTKQAETGGKPPTAADVNVAQGKAGRTDVRKMSTSEFQEYKRKRGWDQQT